MFVLSLKGKYSASCAIKFSLYPLEADLESVLALTRKVLYKCYIMLRLESGPVLFKQELHD